MSQETNKEPENLVLQLLREMLANMAAKSDLGEVKAEMAGLRSEIRSFRADVASDLIKMRGENNAEHHKTREQIVELRRTVVEYHSTVIGHGTLISELEARLRRVEQHLNFPEAH